ncbi:Ldh family oxidoreductase, partial [Psychrobacter sp. T6-1]|uniref:Ldh family oxidoreductase n=1 Tax=Psychrobacter sp. T6-1 TaxID=3457447 RepID=UPI003FD4B966
EAEAGRIGRFLVAANLTGHDSHGVIRVPRYVAWLRDGELVADRAPEVLIDGGAFALVDAQYGFGQTAGPFATDLGIAKAREHGVSVIALRHAGHLGRIGEWAERAAAAGLISVHFVNVAGSLLVAPFGSVERRFSTNPIAAAFPLPGRDPIVLDFATSAVAEGKVLVA